MGETDVSEGTVEVLYHADGELEIRDENESGRWITTDTPMEIRQ